MVHPDYQYTPKLLPAMAVLIENDLYHCVLGSRIPGGYALQGGMPAWRYVSNRLLTLAENLFTGAKLSRGRRQPGGLGDHDGLDVPDFARAHRRASWFRLGADQHP